MLPHHAETIRRTTEHFAADPAVVGLLLGGSLAHGFANADSDVDVMIVVSDEDHRERTRTGRTCFFSRELCTYAAGYVDGKYTSLAFLEQVRDKGSEPARFAFKDAQVLFSRSPTLAPLLAEAARYPTADKASRLWRFQAQFEAWFWFTGEALKRQNLPLLRTAVSKLTLFGGRIVLAHNELLYPFHKWFLRVLESAPEKPAGLLAQIERLAADPTAAAIEEFARSIREFRPWEISHATWPAQFMEDSEVNWLRQPAPVDDL
ncbi:nucleotidyltransferase domain-containing protein [Opitutus terrae]|uniref:DNA polymerase beta domain protein region n=1 Tax=Opitutus terrae (strain DSM 11246 / JCM 15787 / PB90-1) TaxID=452637 RepID=B1ZNT2_OPITP|nr:nucleotidyltransferase domain-containing protein [Opitutus terrae]ACB75452.1 DNA polymerase beta domain protein region [Opitutus terrae PB90-1]